MIDEKLIEETHRERITEPVRIKKGKAAGSPALLHRSGSGKNSLVSIPTLGYKILVDVSLHLP